MGVELATTTRPYLQLRVALFGTRLWRMVVVSVMAYGVYLALFGMSPPLVLALLALVGTGAADSVSVAMRHLVRTIATPAELRGRIAAAHSALAMGGPRLGEFQSGIMVGGAGCILVALAIGRLVPPVMRYRLDRHGHGDFDVGETILADGAAGLPAGQSGRVR